MSNKSPWLSRSEKGKVYKVPVSHGEGRFVCSKDEYEKLLSNGQIAIQYVDENGKASMDTRFNPNGSFMAIEAITSPCGRVLGKMAHSERVESRLAINVPDKNDMEIFRAGVEYFTK